MVPDTSRDESTDSENVPVISCGRCDREWRLSYELDQLRVGNQAIEQFALDHKRHTGHFPDDASPWSVRCMRCPDQEEFLSQSAADRWAEIHARHTRHTVQVIHVSQEEPYVIEF